ncbi:MAG TPA: flavodoxin-dependent (E)-4-hydroxy-3-methylbut-2-enyl-diphosphate synthase, partial [Thermomicrobiales bacterium]|nr:flavodoxin-dependent (E)-4-hydroxy-3-methylbut-2-enyl-diphosphate synthase [Thermomicrobiales bacterium]
MSLIAPRRKTRVLHVGDVALGGEYPIRVQSMATADTRDPKATLAQIQDLADVGCEIVR